MQYRLLRPEEYGRLEEIMPLDHIPNPMLSQVAVAETAGGEIAGILVAQMVIHMEPLIIKPEFTHAVRFNRLVKKLEEIIGHKNYFCFSQSPLIEKMLKFIGFYKLPMVTWKRK